MHEILIVSIAFICGYITAEYNRHLSKEFEDIGKSLTDEVAE